VSKRVAFRFEAKHLPALWCSTHRHKHALTRTPETERIEDEPSLETLKADEAMRLAALLLEAPSDPVYTVAPSPIAREMHKRSAEFWQGKWHARAKPYTTAKGVSSEADRAVPLNAVLADPTIINEHFAFPNTRRCRELPRHLALAGLTEDLSQELVNAAVLDFFVAPSRENAGEVRALFGVLGGMNAAAKTYTEALCAAIVSMDSTETAKMYVRVAVCACLCASVRACARARACVCVCVCVCVFVCVCL
jgi:hypothetical protein